MAFPDIFTGRRLPQVQFWECYYVLGKSQLSDILGALSVLRGQAVLRRRHARCGLQ